MITSDETMRLGHYRVILDTDLKDRIFTRRQTRKLKNRRWVKKYQKKHSKLVPSTGAIINNLNHTIICHPALYHKIKGGW